MSCVVTDGYAPPAHLSKLVSLDDLMPFGKYKGMTIRAMISRDPNYVTWAMNNIGSFKLDEEAYTVYKQEKFW